MFCEIYFAILFLAGFSSIGFNFAENDVFDKNMFRFSDLYCVKDNVYI